MLILLLFVELVWINTNVQLIPEKHNFCLTGSELPHLLWLASYNCIWLLFIGISQKSDRKRNRGKKLNLKSVAEGAGELFGQWNLAEFDTMIQNVLTTSSYIQLCFPVSIWTELISAGMPTGQFLFKNFSEYLNMENKKLDGQILCMLICLWLQGSLQVKTYTSYKVVLHQLVIVFLWWKCSVFPFLCPWAYSSMWDQSRLVWDQTVMLIGPGGKPRQ